MPVTIKVIVHDIKEGKIWPDSVTNLLSRLTQPLPKTLSSDAVQAALSPGAKEMYPEAIGSSSFAVEEGNSSERTGRPVTDLVDTVLSSVRMVRASNAFLDGRQQARKSWTSLVAALGLAILQDVHISVDTSFLKARTQTTTHIQEVRDIEGLATVLLSCILPLRAKTQNKDDAPLEGDGSTEGTGENECDARTEADAGTENETQIASDAQTEDDSDVDMQTQPDSDADMSDGLVPSDNSSSSGSGRYLFPFNIPHDAHILRGCGKRVNCILPVICMADESEIEALVTSVVCQRHVWSIETPVVGIALSKVGSTATLVVGWLVAEEESTAPTVHLLYSHEAGVANHCNGQFDLVDPASALRFAQFILDLQPYFSSIKKTIQAFQTQDFCWRLDLIDFEDKSVSWIEREDRLKAWIDEIDNPCVVTSEAMPPKNKDKANSKPSPQHAQSLKIPSAPRASSKSSEQSSAAKSHYSASEFARFVPRNNLIDDKPGADKFRWERHTLSIACISIPDPMTDLEEQINEMVDRYDHVTAFRWPASWTKPDSVTRCDDAYGHLRSRLYEDYQAYKVALDKDSEQPKLMSKKDETFQSISKHMSIYLKAVANAVVSQEQVSVNGATESAMRSAWDDLLKAICCPPEQALSKTFFVERTIYISKNQAVEEGARFQAVEQARLLQHLLLKQGQNAKISTDVKDLVLHFEAEAFGYVMQVQKSYSVKAEKRAYEPSEAIVDGLYCLEYIMATPPTQPAAADAPSHPDPTPDLWPWATSLIRRIPTPKRKAKCKKSQENSKPRSAAAGKVESQHVRCFMCPAISRSLPSGPPLVFSGELAADSTRIYLPFIFAEYKRDSDGIHQAFHQIQIYCISGIEYLASMGIMDVPVWGIVTTGTEGCIVMAWKSTRSTTRTKSGTSSGTESSANYNIIIDKNVRTFDLTKPLEALHFATSIHEIYKLQGDLRAIADNTDFTPFLNDPSSQNWKKSPVVSLPVPPSSEEPKGLKEAKPSNKTARKTNPS